jgi:dihydrolipoamide dehydrogenase
MGTMPTEIRVPNLGEFKGVEVIEVHVREGDRIRENDPLITLESDKATMDVPATAAGRVIEMRIKTGDRVSEGDLVLVLEPGETGAAAPADSASSEAGPPPKEEGAAAAPAGAPGRAAPAAGNGDGVDVVVLGAGPGGYTAAFRAADLGLSTVLVERYPTLGGVCLNVGCIPSKALLHAARVITETRELKEAGVDFGEPRIDRARLRGWVEQVVGKLTGGLAGLARQRGVRVLRGTGRLTSPHTLDVAAEDGAETVRFRHCIIAAGSRAARLPFLPEDPRIMDSTSALLLREVPERLLVIGGGIIGLEMATVYQALGSRVTVVEVTDGLLPGADPDLVRPLERRIGRLYEGIWTGTKVTAVEAGRQALRVSFEGKAAPETAEFDAILVAVGRVPNGRDIGAEAAGVAVDERGFIPVDIQQRTNVPHILAIGDIVGPPMLAHKATHQGKVAAEVAAGMKSAFEARVVPAVAYTDPEVAWVGLTETEARAQGIEVEKGVFPWAASGRALGLGRSEGLTKLLFDAGTKRLLGAGIVGPSAGDLIAEAALAIEMDCEAGDLALTVHPHPTLSETLAFAAEAAEGTITDLYLPKKRN